MGQFVEGTVDPARVDPDKMDYIALDPGFIADQVIHAINQPNGVSIGDINSSRIGGSFRAVNPAVRSTSGPARAQAVAVERRCCARSVRDPRLAEDTRDHI